jgi:hypothetical protein
MVVEVTPRPNYYGGVLAQDASLLRASCELGARQDQVEAAIPGSSACLPCLAVLLLLAPACVTADLYLNLDQAVRVRRKPMSMGGDLTSSSPPFAEEIPVDPPQTLGRLCQRGLKNDGSLGDTSDRLA